MKQNYDFKIDKIKDLSLEEKNLRKKYLELFFVALEEAVFEQLFPFQSGGKDKCNFHIRKQKYLVFHQ